ncbi:exodeoxyribonuclease V subunit beta [Buchnera aphidicola]|uniref:exodeoxyribonuclease V subunit beta n=1 Tax=Buchnera aphidicola TaxID=9 RepID=UPI003BEF3E25
MKVIQGKKLDIFKISLKNIKLIEASAGTGKTLTIVFLYLRLLLGLKNLKENNKPLLIKEILVLTFTNAAKEELKFRIKENVKNLYLACIEKKSNNPLLILFLKNILNLNQAIQLLKNANDDIDQISIYTIHEFCLKMLESKTIDFHSYFDQKIVKNEDALYLKSIEDFWRYYFYPLSKDIIKNIMNEYSSPMSLFKEIKPLLCINSMNIQHNFKKYETLTGYYNKIINKINNFKKKWLLYYNDIICIINNLKINKRIYHQNNLNRWINIITIWANKKTNNFYIPIILTYFSKKKIESHIINDHILKHYFFKEIQDILKKKFSLKNIIIFYALQKIPSFLKKNKDNKCLFSFNDLLTLLSKNIKKNQYLSQSIRKTYPAAFIDEFQDTDIQQYQIFHKIYKKNINTILFLIGDPKQSIYSFRGADIFSYLYAKNKIKHYYYLDTNWRSSINMCNSINILFSQNNNPFLFKNINFSPVIPAAKNINMNFKIKGKIQTALRFFFLPQKQAYVKDYQRWISKQCAYEISYWLMCAKKGDATITIKNQEKILKKNDICILVRNKIEALIIQKELKNINIESIYLSEKKNIFNTTDAYELLLILKSILNPVNEKLFLQASITHIFQKILSYTNNKKNYFLIEKIYFYHNIWKKKNIFHMIQRIILDYQNNINYFEKEKNHKKNMNFLYLAELLEKKFNNLINKTSLVRWFENKIFQKKNNINTETIKTISDQSDIIKITTIHKSKGLEYPITWIPFSFQSIKTKLSLYHNEQNKKIFFDLTEKNTNFKIAKKEQLAEEIRFLYVALTRSMVHCSIGIASIIEKNKIKNNDHSDIHKSALGYLIQNGCSMNYDELNDKLHQLDTQNCIEINNSIIKSNILVEKNSIKNIQKYDLCNNKKHNIWSITSYTHLNLQNQLYLSNHYPTLSEKISCIDIKKNEKKYTIHSFPKGKHTGKILHNILKEIDFKKNIDFIKFSQKIEKYQINKKWILILFNWINNIINIPITKKNIILSQLKKTEYIKELEFCLPIKKILSSNIFNNLIQSYDPISKISPKLSFNSVYGFLKGFIDLFFIWNKKYYIIDYKSNWLGKNNSYYSIENMKGEIIKHRYDLQYQIYTVAIHQYLKQKIKKYHYNTHFGGVFYIFLRSIEKNNKKNGIFYILPDYKLIKKMVYLFS